MSTNAVKKSRVIGLIGQGIGQSRSPTLHETEARALGIPYAYRLIDLGVLGMGVSDLPTILAGMKQLGFDGTNVTHPAKQAIMPLLDEVDDYARAIGAVNTVVIRDGRTKGYNTDYSGFAEGFRRGVPDADLSHVVQLGAGGAGAATACAILSLGAGRLTLVDVQPSRADLLVHRLRDQFPHAVIEAVAQPHVAMESATGLIHATPTGMAAHPGLPIDPALLRPDMWVAEIVYFPLETELLRVARSIGCRTVDGGGMAVFQAAAAMEYFVDGPVDHERMRAHFLALDVD
ncbi:MAG: shikimate dehydrogenase [Sphingobium sp. 66-54]|nr:MAG: shikimate dehydrogenase [Sphingobium sp. 66-54]